VIQKGSRQSRGIFIRVRGKGLRLRSGRGYESLSLDPASGLVTSSTTKLRRRPLVIPHKYFLRKWVTLNPKTLAPSRPANSDAIVNHWSQKLSEFVGRGGALFSGVFVFRKMWGITSGDRRATGYFGMATSM